MITHVTMHARRRAILIALLCAAAAACKDKNTPTMATKKSALGDSADQVMFGLKHALTTSGVRRGELQADTAFFYDEMNRMELRKVHTLFFDASGVKTATMTALRGTYDVRTQKLDGRGDVVIVAEDGRKLTSPHLTYDRTINQVTSDTTFTFTSPGRNISGVGFRSDPQLRNVQVLSQTRGGTVVPAGGLSRTRPQPTP
jgi:LPS export ABC transporter protein LptC